MSDASAPAAAELAAAPQDPTVHGCPVTDSRGQQVIHPTREQYVSVAKALLADSYRQMGYAAEGALWRNMYLQAASELETGPVAAPASSLGIARFIPTSMLLDLMAVRLVPERAPETPFTLALVFPDVRDRHYITVRTGVMVHEAGVADAADVSITLPRAAFLRLLAGAGPLAEPPLIEGQTELLPVFMGLFETPPTDFPIVTP